MYLLSGENFNPHISYKWPANEYIGLQKFSRTSNNLIILSLDPDTNKLSYQCNEPIQELLTKSFCNTLFFKTSVIKIWPFESLIAILFPSLSKDNEQTYG